MASGKGPGTLTLSLITGLFMILLTYVLYMGGVDTYMGTISYLGYIFLIILAIVAVVLRKKANNGYLDFRQVVQVAFTVFVVGLAFQAFFNWILLNYMDIPFYLQVREKMAQRLESYLRKMNTPEDKIDSAISDIRNKQQFTLRQTIFGLMIWYLPFFLIALAIAAIMKKNKPEIAEESLFTDRP